RGRHFREVRCSRPAGAGASRARQHVGRDAPASGDEAGSDEPPRNNIWIGAPSAIIYEVEVPRELRSDSFEILVNIIQRTLGDPGHVSTLGRSLHWASVHQQRRLQISMVPRNRRTTIRVDERLQPVIGGIFGGMVGGGGGGVGGGAALPITIALTHSPLAGLGAFGATALAAYLAARGIYRQV